MIEFLDNELIYLWRENFSREAMDALKNRYFEYLIKVLMKSFYIRFNASTIEKDDFLSLLDNWFIDITLSYNYSQNKIRYVQYLIVQAKQCLNNLSKSLNAKKHYVLNESISYSSNCYLNKTISNNLEIFNPEDYFNSNYEYEMKIDWIKNFLDNYDNASKEMFWLYFHGEEKESIMEKLSLTKMELNNRLFYMIRKMKNTYLKSIEFDKF